MLFTIAVLLLLRQYTVSIQLVYCFIFIFKTGYGQEYGEIIVEMTNHLKEQFLNVLYVEVLPWYIRPYLHSLRMEVTHRGNKLPVPAGKLVQKIEIEKQNAFKLVPIYLIT